MIGRILQNQYRIIQQLGRGGLATAYLVEDLNPEYKTRPLFVVKHLQPDYTNCKNQSEQDYLWKKALELFVREAKVVIGRSTYTWPKGSKRTRSSSLANSSCLNLVIWAVRIIKTAA